jgi:hypothetical protein
MSDDPPRERDRKPPPNLRLGLKEKPSVKALLVKLGEDLEPGADPLFYEMPDAPDDPSACAPNEARVYAGPTAPPTAHHKTLEMDRVKVSPAVDPRRAVTQKIAIQDRGATTAAEGEAPTRKRTTVVGMIAVGAAVAAIGAAATWGPPRKEAAGSAAAMVPSSLEPAGARAAAPPSTVGGAVVPPAPSTTAAAATAATSSAAPSQPLKAPLGRAPGPLEDPYADAAVAPSPAVTAAPSTEPTVPPVAPPAIVPKAIATATPARPAPVSTSGRIVGGEE